MEETIAAIDAITLRMVLEHVHDPVKMLASAYEALAPGGYLCVAVPNLAAWGYRAFGPAWFPLRLPWHLLHFTPDTLRRVVADRGFVIDTIATKGHTRWMGYSVDRAKALRPWCRQPCAGSVHTTRCPAGLGSPGAQWTTRRAGLARCMGAPCTAATAVRTPWVGSAGPGGVSP